MTINGRAAVAIAAGTLFVWSGVKGWSILGTAGDLLTGKKPEGVDLYPLLNTDAPPAGSTGAVAGNTPSAIANTALQYRGHAYRFGGAPGADGSQPWDCSSFCNFVIGVKLGGAIPGYGAGKYTGSSHGPATGNWVIWNGLRTIQASEVQAGDIIIWGGHMGIAVSNTQLVSALNPNEGTRVTNIQGTAPGPILRYGRYGG